jgi:hypothetical protein
MSERVQWSARRVVSSAKPKHAARAAWLRWCIGTNRIDPTQTALTRGRHVARSVVRRVGGAGPIWAIAMARDEADIIEETIANLFDQGVDDVLVADHLSTDDTPRILERLSASRRVHVVRDPIRAYWQADKMNHLARVATALGASWIIPFDADEIWRSRGCGTVGDVLRTTDADIVWADWFTYFPTDSRAGETMVERFPYRLPEPHNRHKMAFRANWLARIGPGNHAVTLPAPVVAPGLRIAHFTFRSPEQMLRKARVGADAARRSGISNISYWPQLEHGDEHDVERLLAEKCAGQDLMFDPVTEWTQ